MIAGNVTAERQGDGQRTVGGRRAPRLIITNAFFVAADHRYYFTER